MSSNILLSALSRSDAHIGLNPLTYKSAIIDRITSAAAVPVVPVASTSKSKPIPAKKPVKAVGSAPASTPTAEGSTDVPTVAKVTAPKVSAKPLAEQYNAKLVKICLENADMNKPDLLMVAYSELKGVEDKLVTKAGIVQSMKDLGLSKDKTKGAKWYFSAEVLVSRSRPSRSSLVFSLSAPTLPQRSHARYRRSIDADLIDATRRPNTHDRNLFRFALFDLVCTRPCPRLDRFSLVASYTSFVPTV